jgi:hypothetical protein
MIGEVIAICGMPGAGKTTISHALAERIGGTVVSYDDYETFTRRPLPEVLDWLQAGAPYERLEAPGLDEALRRASRNGPVVFDTPLGRAHPQSGHLINYSVWLDCPADLALARKISQLLGQVRRNEAADFLSWLGSYLDHYSTITRPACAIQVLHVKPLCEIEIPALDSIVSTLATIEGGWRGAGPDAPLVPT